MGQCAFKGCDDRHTRRVPAPGPGNQTLDVCMTHLLTLEDMMAKICLVTNCGEKRAAKGLCMTHYGRYAHHGWIPDGGLTTAQEADALQAQWEERRASVAKVPPVPREPKTIARQSTHTASSPPVQRVAEEVVERPRVRARASTPPDTSGKAKITKLEAQVRELSAARDRVAEDAKALREENRRLIAEQAPPQRPDPTAMDWRDDALEGAKKDRDRYAEDLKIANAKLRTVEDRLDKANAEVQRLTALDLRMEPVREELSKAGLPAMDSYADTVRYLVRQRDAALSGTPTAAAVSSGCESHLSALLARDEVLMAAVLEAMVRDFKFRMMAKSKEDLIAILAGPVASPIG